MLAILFYCLLWLLTNVVVFFFFIKWCLWFMICVSRIGPNRIANRYFWKYPKCCIISKHNLQTKERKGRQETGGWSLFSVVQWTSLWESVFPLLNQLKSLDLKLSSKNSLLQANPVDQELGCVLEFNKSWNFQLESLELLGSGNSTHTKPRAGGSRVSWGLCQGRIQGGSISWDKRGLNSGINSANWSLGPMRGISEGAEGLVVSAAVNIPGKRQLLCSYLGQPELHPVTAASIPGKTWNKSAWSPMWVKRE